MHVQLFNLFITNNVLMSFNNFRIWKTQRLIIHWFLRIRQKHVPPRKMLILFEINHIFMKNIKTCIIRRFSTHITQAFIGRLSILVIFWHYAGPLPSKSAVPRWELIISIWFRKPKLSIKLNNNLARSFHCIHEKLHKLNFEKY